MIIPDTNLLLYAYDESSPFHAKAAAWWESLMNGKSQVIMLPSVIFGFVRISTNPRVFSHPLSISKAAKHIQTWLGRKQVSVHDMITEDVEKVLLLLKSAETAGNLTTDAQIASMALRLDAEVHTADLDFGRFQGVRFTNPLL